jgi:SAM-dependent methyltransferase
MSNYPDYAEYYDFVTPFWEDIPFYLEYARRAGSPVLELACGTGRVLLPMVEAGVEVYGVDISGNMLSLCRRKAEEQGLTGRIGLIRADMTTFDLPRKDFAFAYIALRSFMHLYTQADQLACLHRIYEHLRPGAYFIVDIYAPAFEQIAQPTEGAFLVKHEVELPNRNHVIRRDRFVRNDVVDQIKYTEIRFEEYSPSGDLMRERTLPLNTRYTFRYELQLLLEKAGFECVDFFRDYEKNPFDGTGEIIAVARRL